MKALVDRALAFQTLAIADLVAIFEDARPAARAERIEALRLLRDRPRGIVAGITGTPGSGKSTLIGKLALALRRDRSVAVIAVDPSSAVSGGALLGDRVRVRFPPDDSRLYFRSQANESELGGLGPDTFQVCRLLCRLFDVVFVETVGVGQSEADVQALADRTYLVLQPLAGDEVQLLKAGVMEVPDAIVVNKCDAQPAARKLVAALSATLPLARPFGEPVPVLQTSARDGVGIDAFADDIARATITDDIAKEARFFTRWVRREWGRAGERVLDGKLGGARAYLAERGGYDEAEASFDTAMKQALAKEV